MIKILVFGAAVAAGAKNDQAPSEVTNNSEQRI